MAHHPSNTLNHTGHGVRVVCKLWICPITVNYKYTDAQISSVGRIVGIWVRVDNQGVDMNVIQEKTMCTCLISWPIEVLISVQVEWV